MPLHYYNTDDLPPHFCQTTFPRFQNEGKNLVNAARNYTLRLSSSHSVDMQDLSFFLHFMMDLHQPLHCTKYSFNVLPHHSFTVSSRLFGGNRIKVLFAGRRVSLHSLWDTHLLAHILRFSGAHPSLRRKRLLKMFRQRVVRFLKTSPRRITCDHWQTPQDLEACINNWAADTNAANCKAVWGDAVFEAGSDLASSSKYYYHARQTLLNLIVLGAMRTALLLQSCCE